MDYIGSNLEKYTILKVYTFALPFNLEDVERLQLASYKSVVASFIKNSKIFSLLPTSLVPPSVPSLSYGWAW